MDLCVRFLYFSYLLNIFDLLATLSLVSQFGIGAEGNPIGQLMLSSPQIAVAVKVFGVAALLLILFLNRQRRLAHIGTYVIFTAYALLFCYHVAIRSLVAL